MPLTEPQQSRNRLLRNVIHERAYRARLLQPVTLPQLSRPDALVTRGLEVRAAGHGPAVDFVDDARGGEEPHLVAPLLRIPLRVLSGVIVDQMYIFDVLLELRDGGWEGSCVGCTWHF